MLFPDHILNNSDNRKNVQPINLLNIFENASKCEVDQHQFFYNSKTCVVTEMIHFKATLQEVLELDRFPFDRQYLTLRLCIHTEDFHCLSSPPSYVPDRLGMRTLATYTCAPSISGWRIFSPVTGTSRASGQPEKLRITISLRVERIYEYFMSNIVLVIFLIVLLAPIAFVISFHPISDRIQVILTLLLTVVTFKFVIKQEVPKISTVTLLDQYMIFSLLMLFLVVIQTSLANLVGLGSVFDYDPDALCTVGMLSFWILFHIAIVWMAKTGWFYQPWSEMKDEAAEGSEYYVIDPENMKLGEASKPGKGKGIAIKTINAIKQRNTQHTQHHNQHHHSSNTNNNININNKNINNHNNNNANNANNNTNNHNINIKNDNNNTNNDNNSNTNNRNNVNNNNNSTNNHNNINNMNSNINNINLNNNHNNNHNTNNHNNISNNINNINNSNNNNNNDHNNNNINGNKNSPDDLNNNHVISSNHNINNNITSNNNSSIDQGNNDNSYKGNIYKDNIRKDNIYEDNIYKDNICKDNRQEQQLQGQQL
eukprot:TRINITY_DN3882_c0_g4_i9.p1 TRINITY_DN3882_c0_g4~~TRINITY_DN3882_c0_g4_i9.p1  ORF type:complete len:540 (-),score=124.44 TRINITY_DN3882_c0_g4_i9:886-2505(-)